MEISDLPISALDRGVYVGLAVVGAMPLFLLVAAIRQIDLTPATRDTKRFLHSWIRAAPTPVRQRARQLLGFSGGFLIVVLFAWTCDQIAKALLPAAFERAGSGYCLARFSEADAVETFENAFRMNWTADGRGDIVAGMGLSRFKWDHGRTGARWSRTLAIYGTVLLTGGIFDLFSRHKARGRGLVFVGVVTSIAFASIWGRQESNYLRYMLQQNWTLSSPVTVPSLPCELPRQS